MTEATQHRAFATYPDLAGKVAVVTGGSKGIGAATCRALASNGVSVAVVARDQPGIDQMVASLIDSGGHAAGFSVDAMKYAEVDDLRRRVEERLGPTDILMPFAGGFDKLTAVTEITEEDWRFVIDSNLTATFFACKAFLPGMQQRGRGAIVTMASNVARTIDVLLTASYAAAKAGVVQFTRHVAKEMGSSGVRINCIAPATTLTERIANFMTDERLQQMSDLSTLKRIGMPEDSAMAALFLASDSASWLTGITIDVAGGRVMH
ncbi:MAG: SDR family oxidoreductase [Candidatus Dormibacteraeota bacterium]|nr:SDR family oxidoreductase [Candidatus Dormibacteraeota bacterium]